jgi:hypothetical protein
VVEPVVVEPVVVVRIDHNARARPVGSRARLPGA